MSLKTHLEVFLVFVLIIGIIITVAQLTDNPLANLAITIILSAFGDIAVYYGTDIHSTSS